MQKMFFKFKLHAILSFPRCALPKLSAKEGKRESSPFIYFLDPRLRGDDNRNKFRN